MFDQFTFKVGLSQAVPNNGTLTIPYTAAVRESIDTRLTAQHILIVDDNNQYQSGDGEFSVVFGDTNFTVTNKTGQSWSVGTVVSVGLASIGSGFSGQFFFDFALRMKRIDVPAYTLRLSDRGKMLVFLQGCTVTLPNSLPEGWSCGLLQWSSSAVVTVAASGAFRGGRQGATATAGQFSEAGLVVVTNDDMATAAYALTGDTV